MKKSILTLIAMLMGIFIYSQAPQKFTYQSIVRSADGSVLRSSDIGLQISILKNSAIGQSVYTETHSARSNANGLVTVVIGDGVSGDNISDIDWSTGQYYIKVEVDPSGGIGYSIEQTAQLLSVPYALYAGNSSSSTVDLDKDVEGVLPVSRGGTGSSTSPMIGVVTAPDASTARAILGIDDKKGSKVELKNVTDNYLSIKDKTDGSGNQELEAGTVPVTLGGTGSTTAPMVGVITAADAAAARSVLGLEDAVEKYTIPVTLRYVNQNYLRLNGQELIASKVPISLGGTGSTTAPMVGVITAADAAAARKVLGVDAAGDGGKVFLSSVPNNYLSIQNANDGSGNQTLTAGTVPVTLGGTGSNTAPMVAVITAANAADARSILGLEDAVEKFTIPVSLKNVPNNYLSLSGQEITSGIVPVTLGGTGSNTAPMVAVITAADPAAARAVLEIDKAGTDNSTAVTLANVADNYLSLNGQEITSGIVPVTLGGTGSSTAPMVGVITAANALNARNVLGLGTIAIQNKDAVNIDGGAIDGTPIGSSNASSGDFTTVETTDNISIGGNNKELRFYSGSNYVGFRAPSLSANKIWSLPTEDGSPNQVLKTDGGGNLSWTSNSGSATIAIDDLTDAKKAGNNFAGSMLIGNETPGALGDGDPANNNIGVGEIALDALTTGDNNIAVGYDALTALTTAGGNTAIGAAAGKQTIAGGDNVFVGNSAGDANTTGQQNVIIGSGSDASAADGTNQIAIGYGVTGGGNNTVVLGNGDVTAWLPTDTNEVNLGASDKQLKDVYVDGVTYTDALGFGTTAMTLPTADGTNGQVLKTDGSGTLSWTANGSGSGVSAIDDLTDGKSGGTGFTGSMLLGHETTGTLNEAQNNTAVGLTALDAVTEGDDNTAVGFNALTGLTTGSKNVAVGKGAMTAAVTGEGNMAVGYNALNSVTSGGGNVAIGRQVLSKVEGGSKNVGIGRQAGIQIVGGAVGGTSLVSGSQNTYIGAETVPSAADANNETVIGQGATGGGNNTVVLGNGDVTAWLPTDTNEVDLGASAKQLKDVYVDGVTYTDALGFGTTAMTLPTADGTNGQVLKTDGSGTLSWTANGSGSGASVINDLTDAAVTNNSSAKSVYLGHDPSATDINSEYNVAVGTTALDAVTDADFNVAVGQSALTNATTVQSNVAIGFRALYENIDGGQNVAIGGWSLYKNTGQRNTGVGHQSVYSNTTGVSNTGLGYKSLYLNTTGNQNTALGHSALYSSTTGYGNTSVGEESLYSNTEGLMNTAIGENAGYLITTGKKNVMLGARTDPDAADGENQIVIGFNADGKGDNKAVLGNNDVTDVYMAQDMGAMVHADGVKFYEDTANGTNYVGFNSAAALGGDQVWTLPTADGTDGQVLKTDGSGALSWVNNSGVAGAIDDLTDAKSGGTDFTDSMILGHQTTGTLNSAIRNTAVGYQALDAITEGDNNTAIGYKALTENTTGATNVAVGNWTLSSNTAGQKNVAVGYGAMADNTGGYENTAVGFNALHSLGSTQWNTAVGMDAMYSQTSGGNNTAVGRNAMRYGSTGVGNTGLGADALIGVYDGTYNTAVGYRAMTNSSGGKNDYNTAMGNKSLYSISTGDGNVVVGNEAGLTLNTGSYNVLIGNSADPSANNATNQIVIGHDADGLGNNKAVIGNDNITDVYMAEDMGAMVHADGVKFYEDTANGANYVGFQSAATLGGDQVWTLPPADGTDGQVLKTDGSGTLSWTANGSGSGASAIDDLSDAKSGGTEFTNSMILGHQTTGTLNNAQNNTAIGINALQSITEGDSNTALGVEALSENTSGGGNTALGMRSLFYNSTGMGNSSVGHEANFSNQDGRFNTALGYKAMYGGLGKKEYNTAVGFQSLYQITTGDNNTALGHNAGYLITTGSKNVLIGDEARTNANNSENQIVIGYDTDGKGDNKAVIGNTSVTDVYMAQDMGATVHADGVKFYEDTANGTHHVGFQSAAALGGDQVWTLPTADGTDGQVLKTDGSGALAWVNNSGVAGAIDDLSDAKSGGNASVFYQSLILGHQTTGTLNDAQYNTAVGYASLDGITSGDNNTALGHSSLSGNSNGSDNTAVGYMALFINDSGVRNTAVGSNSLDSNTTGNSNSAFGRVSLASNSTGYENTAVGAETLVQNTIGKFNAALGYYSLYANVDGEANVALGWKALRNNTSADNNIAIGRTAGELITTGGNNIMIGANTDPSANTGTNQIVIGSDATGLGDNKAVIGSASVTDVYMAQDMGAMVHADGVKFYEDTANGTNYVGFQSAATLGGDQVWTLPTADGTDGQVLKTDGSGTLSWTANGGGSGASAIDDLSDAKGAGTNFIGSMILGHQTTGTLNNAYYNTAVGIQALDAITEGDHNVAVGFNALTANTSGNRNTAVGMSALDNNTTGNLNTAVGNEALKSNTEGDDNTAVGWEALSFNTTGERNSGLGVYALRNTSTGVNNTALGYKAGDQITTGSNNVLIGHGADPSANTGTNQIVIGSDATGLGDNKAVIGSASVTDVYMAQDMGAMVHADGVKFYEDTANGTHHVGFQSAAALGGDQVWTLPTADGTDGQVLKTDGSGTLAWVNNSGVAGALNDLSDVLVDTYSYYIGNIPANRNSANYNYGIGHSALNALTTGDGNIAIGYQTLQLNTTGGSNTAIGKEALESNTTATNNTAVGSRALQNNQTGIDNIAVGSDALISNATGSYNTAVGKMALKELDADGNFNTAIGHQAGDIITTGDNNIMIGHDANPHAQAGINQIVIGHNARGKGNNMAVFGDDNTTDVYMAEDMGATVHADGVKFYEDTANGTNYVGFQSAAALGGDQVWTLPTADGTDGQVLKTDGSGALAWVNNSGVAGAIDDLSDGKSAGTSFTGSMILGHQTTGTLNNATYNTAVGITAMDAITEGDFNVAVGWDALTGLTTARKNVAIGYGSISGAVTGDENTAIGYEALKSNTDGTYNTAVGSGALSGNTTGDGNVGVGRRAGSGGNWNTAVGHMSLTSNGGDSNTAIGYMSMYTQTTGGQGNTALGYKSLYTNLSSDYNVAVGYGTLQSHTGGVSAPYSYATAVGYKALQGNTTGANNTAFGYFALKLNTTGSRNTGLGDQAGDVITEGNDNVLIGYNADPSANNATNQIVIGSGATGGGNNTVVLGNGDVTAWLPSDNNEVDLGASAKQLKDVYVDGVTYTDALGFGTTAMTLPTADGTNGQVLKTDGNGTLSWTANGGGGSGAIDDLTDAKSGGTNFTGSMILGHQTTGTLNNANYNTAVGIQALDAITSGQKIVAVGYNALGKNTSGTSNTAVGMYALNNNTIGHLNTAVGNEAMKSNTEGENNTAVGWEALSSNTTGDRNAGLGLYVLRNNSSGNNNTALGYEAGDVITTGSNNVIIGYGADPSENSATNQIVIGYGATGTGSNEIALGNTSISAIKAQVNSITAYSDRRIKREINDSKLGLDFIMKLRPVTYKMKNPADYPDEILEDRFKMDVTSGPNNEATHLRPADDETIYDGLIAQEVKEAIDEAGVNWSGWSENESDGKQGVQYGALTIPLIKAVQEQQETINSLKKVNQELSERLEAIEKALLK